MKPYFFARASATRAALAPPEFMWTAQLLVMVAIMQLVLQSNSSTPVIELPLLPLLQDKGRSYTFCHEASYKGPVMKLPIRVLAVPPVMHLIRVISSFLY